MEILEIFIEFINMIFSIKIFDIELIDILFTFAFIIVIFKIIEIIGNSNSNKKEKKKND